MMPILALIGKAWLVTGTVGGLLGAYRGRLSCSSPSVLDNRYIKKTCEALAGFAMGFVVFPLEPFLFIVEKVIGKKHIRYDYNYPTGNDLERSGTRDEETLDGYGSDGLAESDLNGSGLVFDLDVSLWRKRKEKRGKYI